jgi:hypothetical protein
VLADCVPGVRNQLSGGAVTEPSRLEGFTDENGETRIDFEILELFPENQAITASFFNRAMS